MQSTSASAPEHGSSTLAPGASPRSVRRLPSWAGFAAIVGALCVVHFHQLEIFHRALIKHDDSIHVGPLADLSLAEYFTSWLSAPDHYAFPLRDMTFWLDFRLSSWTGVQLLWVTQLVYFVLVLWVLRGIVVLLAEHLQWSPATADLFVALVGLHPTSVEVVQWISIRKHLLPALLVAIGTRWALRLRLNARTPSAATWLAFAGLYVASLLCYPSAALWLPWVLWLFRGQLRARPPVALAVALASVGLLVATLVLVVGNNVAFSSHARHLLLGADLPAAALTWLEAVGRGFANFVFPLRIGPYYTKHSPLAWGGVALLLVVLGWAASRLRGANSPARSLAIDLFVLSVALFVPSSYVLVNAREYIWGDHYAFLPEPYLLLALAVLVPARWGIRGWPRPARLAAVAVLALLAVRSAAAAEPWRSDEALFGHCADHEGAPRCTALAIARDFDAGGCSGAVRHILAARKLYARLASLDELFALEVPFFDGLCMALRDLGAADARFRIEEMNSYYGRPQGLLFPAVLLELRHREVERARRIAYSSYLGPGFRIRTLNGRLLNMLRGQAEALCRLSTDSEAGQWDCRMRQAGLAALTQRIPVGDELVRWGLDNSLAPFGVAPP